MQVVVFDLDDTLYPERQFVLSGFRHVARYLMEHCEVRENLYRRMLALFNWGGGSDIFSRVLAAAGYDPDPALIRVMNEIYRTHPPDIALYPDAEMVLFGIRRSQRLHLGLLTGGDMRAQMNKVTCLGLPAVIDKIVYTERLQGQDGPCLPLKGYLEIQDHFGARGSACIFVGDSPSEDFATARELGWLTVRIKRGGAARHSRSLACNNGVDYVVGSMFEAASVLKLDSLCLN